MNRRTHKARAVLRDRQWTNRQWALYTRHLRQVAWFGDSGERCYGCVGIPWHSWEKPDQEQRDWKIAMRASHLIHSDMWDYVQYAASLRHMRKQAA